MFHEDTLVVHVSAFVKLAQPFHEGFRLGMSVLT